MSSILFIFVILFFPDTVFANESANQETVLPFDITHHLVGYLSILITVSAYVAAMAEDVIELRKSKPMVMGSAIVWFAICICYALNGEAKVAAVAFESNLLAISNYFCLSWCQ